MIYTLRYGDVIVVQRLDRLERRLISERTKAGLDTARARGRKRGRKPKLTPTDIKKAKAMLSDPEMTKSEVADHFKVIRPTLNNALNKRAV